MIDFESYYNDYLGIGQKELEEGKRVFSSNQRNIPLNHKFVYKLIGTILKDKVIFSIAPEFYNDFRKFIYGRNIIDLDDVVEVS